MSDRLRTKLAAVRRKSVVVNVGSGTCLAAAFIIAAIGVGMVIDWWIELPFLARTALLAIDLAVLITLTLRDIIWPLLARADDDDVALWIEHDSPGLRSRLIAAIQLTRAEAAGAGHSPSLVRALVRQTEEIAEPMDFMRVVKTDRLARLAALASLVVVLAGVGMAYGGVNSVDLLKRAILIPGIDVPRKTRVQNLTPDQLVVATGDSVELRAQASGIIPRDGSVTIHYDGGADPLTLSMPADADHAKQFAAKVDAVSRSFTYRITLNDGHSTDCHVRASNRPSVVSLDITENYPPYTQLDPIKQSPGDLHVLAGSRLSIHVTANKPVKNTGASDPIFNRIEIAGKTSVAAFPLLADAAERQNLHAADIPMPADAKGISIHLIDDDGLQTKDPAEYAIDLIADQPPTLHITYPDRKEQLSTARAQLLIGVEASDDFALGSLVLHYRVLPPDLAETIVAENGIPADASPPIVVPIGKHHRDEPQPALQAISDDVPLDLKGTPKEFRGRFNFDLSRLKAPALEHGAVEWWLEAIDTNDVTGPGKTMSEHYLTRIGTEAEVRADLFARLGNDMGEMKEAAETQKQDNADLGEMIQEKVNPSP